MITDDMKMALRELDEAADKLRQAIVEGIYEERFEYVHLYAGLVQGTYQRLVEIIEKAS